MANPTQYTLSLREMVEMIIKSSDIHEGHWVPLVNIHLGTGNFGPTPEQTYPGAFTAVAGIGIQKSDPGAPLTPGGVIVDAATVNPKAKKSDAT